MKKLRLYNENIQKIIVKWRKCMGQDIYLEEK